MLNQIQFNLDKYKHATNTPTKSTAHEWQARALEMCEGLKAPTNKRSEVFRMVKTRRTKAESVYRYMQERGIQNVFYFFKVMNSDA